MIYPLAARRGMITPLARGIQRASGVTTVVYDEFTDDDGTLLENHTPNISPIGSSWAKIATTDQKIYNNAAVSYGGDSGGYIESGFSDCVITAKLFSSYSAAALATRHPTVIFRYDGTDFLKVVANLYSDKFIIYDVDGTTELASASVSLGANTWYTIQVTLNGTSIIATLDGANTISCTALSNETGTKHGYCNFRYVADYYYAYCDNFTVTTLS